MRKVFSRQTLDKFEDASASIPLRQLDRVFEAANIRAGKDPGGAVGARKAQFRRYVATIDQHDPKQLERLSDALGAMIGEVAVSKQEFLVKAAESDGFSFAHGAFRPAPARAGGVRDETRATSVYEDSQVAAEIQGRLDRALSHFKRSDYRAVVEELFAPDAVFVRPGATIVGRGALEAMYAQRRGRVVDGWARTTEVRVHGDIAYEFGTNSITTEYDDGARAVAAGRYLTVWGRQADGSWLIVADAPMADPA